ncbi:DUF7095 family protein [Halalkalicoccus subterraneus]|uniref:DUF7095 family protein n=1 Tax=Halalkalicoccus subterraneus TaxID=2675002 RepID=UPI000EFC9F8C|nr:hypothetical protein [Halalkalicoccus subterraneus]
MDRSAAVERVERLVETVESDPMPVPVREIWVYGEVSLGLDPIERLDVYLTKDVLLGGGGDSDRSEEFEERYGVKGIGGTVRSEWAETFPEHIRANDNGYAAPEKCLAAHLIGDDEPIHLEVCNASFEDNVTQRLQGAKMRNDYEQILDPRGVCLWVDGRRSEEAFGKLRSGELVLPTLPEALGMLGMDEGEASEAAETLQAYRERQQGATVRGDVV